MYNPIIVLRRNPDYARLWLSGVISLLGDWFSIIVLMTLVAQYSGGSGIAISAYLIARMVAPALISPFAGVFADRYNRKHILILCDVARTIIVLGFLLVRGPDDLWLIYVLTIAQFVMTALFTPAKSAILPSVVRPEDLITANINESITWSVMLAAGAMFGGLVASILGTQIALAIDALTFSLSALLLMKIHYPRASSIATSAQSPRTTSFRDGLRYAFRHPQASSALFIKVGGQIGNLEVLMSIFATQIFLSSDNGTATLSLFYAALGIGAVIGPLALNRWNDGQLPTLRRLVIAGFSAKALSWFLLAMAPNIWTVALALCINAMGGSANWTFSSVIIQKVTDNTHLGRMFSLDELLWQAGAISSALVTGGLTEVYDSYYSAFLFALVSLVPLVAWGIFIFRFDRRPLAIPCIK